MILSLNACTKDFEEIKLVKYTYRLGSMGERYTFIIYGIVQLKNGKKVIIQKAGILNIIKD